MIPKFKTAEERERKDKIRNKIFSFFVIFILLFSIAAYGFLSFREKNEGEKYGKFNFVREEAGWKAEINNYFILTQYNPKEVEGIYHEGEIKKEDFENIIYFIAKTENEKQAADEINQNIVALQKNDACLPEDAQSEECTNMTIKSCNDGTYLQQIVIVREDERLSKNDTFINYEDNCLNIMGKDKEELIKAADKTIFMIFDIINF